MMASLPFPFENCIFNYATTTDGRTVKLVLVTRAGKTDLVCYTGGTSVISL